MKNILAGVRIAFLLLVVSMIGMPAISEIMYRPTIPLETVPSWRAYEMDTDALRTADMNGDSRKDLLAIKDWTKQIDTYRNTDDSFDTTPA